MDLAVAVWEKQSDTIKVCLDEIAGLTSQTVEIKSAPSFVYLVYPGMGNNWPLMQTLLENGALATVRIPDS